MSMSEKRHLEWRDRIESTTNPRVKLAAAYDYLRAVIAAGDQPDAAREYATERLTEMASDMTDDVFKATL